MPTIKKLEVKKLMFEKEAWSNNEFVCGIDEVGRGCFAGPIVAAAVILNQNAKYKYLKDSKSLTSDERNRAYKWITTNSQYAVAIVNHRIIDNLNINQANIIAMKRSLYQLLAISFKLPSFILVDFVELKLNINIPVFCFSKGENKSSSIAAASIVAKVTRDNLMKRMEINLPGYDFCNNKGYGTLNHRVAIKDNGFLIVHRKSFLKKFLI